MKKKILLFAVLLIVLSLAMSAGAKSSFQCIDSWKLDVDIFGTIRHTLITEKGEIVGGFYKHDTMLLSPGKAGILFGRGQGPDELQDVNGICSCGKDLGIIEFPSKIKIFSRRNGTYHWKKTLWLKRSKFLNIVRSGACIDGKWYLAGMFLRNFSRKYVYKRSYLKVYDRKGNLLKNLINKTTHKPDQSHLMDYYVVDNGNNVLFLAENNLNVRIVDKKRLTVVRDIDLHVPQFYRKMPADYYAFKQYRGGLGEFERDLEKWRSTYSRIVFAGTGAGSLVLQVRCFDPEKENFALLFYDRITFDWKNTIFTKHRLLGIREGKFYFYANGDPQYEEKADKCEIKIFAFAETNEAKKNCF